ncbi:MAG: enoyl-CoA hydratase/isomerase family protein, partial [Pseudomonadota bacterium]|nr:enoyl-CoA hydratase/isomerase family protein [Pseudomonadota bacterium]
RNLVREPDMTTDFKLLTVARAGRVATVTIDNPPVNVITMALLAELEALSVMLKRDPDLTVVVMRSADPDFFLAHFDVAAILERPTAGTAQRDAQIKPFHSLCERFRTMNKVVIGQIEGRIGGGGSELAANFDMRFGVRGKTRVNQMEVPLGIMPGGTGTQRLPRLIGHGRAMELILSGDDMDAETAERWGYLNRIFAPDAITPYVDNLARRIASFPPTAVRVAKESVNNSEKPWLEGLFEEAYLFEGLLRTEAAQRNMQRFLEIGGQTREGESRMDELCAALGETDVT